MKKLLFTFFILLAPTLASAATIGKVPSNNIGLVGYWTFDGADMVSNVRDKSGNGNNGTLFARVGGNTIGGWPNGTTTLPGKIGQALSYTFGDVEIDVGSASSLDDVENQGGGGMTASVWVYPNNGGNMLQAGIDCTNSSHTGQWSFKVGFSIGTLDFCKAFGTTNLRVVTNNSIVPFRTWSFVTVTWDGSANASGVRLYINGVENTSRQTTTDGVGGKTSDAALNKFLNNGIFTGSDDYIGYMDDERLYNRVLSPNEIKALYNVGSAKVGKISATASTTPLSNGLVGYWTLDGSKTNWATGKTFDSSGLGNTAQIINMSTSSAQEPGVIGQGFRFTGRIDRLDMGTNALENVTDAITVSVWAKKYGNGFDVSGSGVSGGVIEKQQQSSGNAAWSIEIIDSDVGNPNKVIAYTANLSDQNIASAQTIQNNKWYHLVFTYDGATKKLYINGILESQEAATGQLISTAGQPVYIGFARGDGNGLNYLNGVVDDARVYNRALFANEVSQLYNSGSAKVGRSGAVVVPATAPLSNGLVGYWTLDGSKTNWATGSTSDSSGNRNTGQLTSMSTTSSPALGKVGQAFNFDNVDDKIVAGTGSSLNITGSITISAWIYPRSFGSNSKGRIFDKADGANVGYDLQLENAATSNGFSWTIGDGSGGSCISNSNTISLRIWQHVVFTYDGSSCRFYVNTVAAGVTTFSVNPPSALSTNAAIGGRASTNDREFDGLIDEVRVYNRALSANEIKQLYNATK